MRLFNKDKTSSTSAQQVQQQRQLLETTQTQLREAEETISQLQNQFQDDGRRVHLYRTQASRLTSDLQSSRAENARLASELPNSGSENARIIREWRDLGTQLVATRGNLNAERNQRQIAETRVQEAELRYRMVVSSMEEELGRARRQLDQMAQEKEEHNRLCRIVGRQAPSLNSGVAEMVNNGGGSGSSAPQTITTPAAVNGSPQVLSARQSVPSFRPVPMGVQPPSNNADVNGNGRRITGAPQDSSQSQAYPVRPRSAMNFGPLSHIQPSRAPGTTSNDNRTPSTMPMQHIPEFIIAELPTAQESMSEEAQHRRAILESAEITRYEERIRTAEASREQMQSQFTALSGEVANLKKTLKEKERELFVRDNQLEWVQQRAAALMRGDGDSLFSTD